MVAEYRRRAQLAGASRWHAQRSREYAWPPRGSCCMQRLPKTLSGQPGATCLLRTTYDGASCLWWSPARTRAEVDLSYHVRAVLWGAGAARCLWPPLRAARHFCNRQVAGSTPRAPSRALAPPCALGARPLKWAKTMKEGQRGRKDDDSTVFFVLSLWVQRGRPDDSTS